MPVDDVAAAGREAAAEAVVDREAVEIVVARAVDFAVACRS